MDEKKKNLIKNILIYGGLALLIAFVIITSIVINYKNKELDDLKNKNQHMEEVLSKKNILNHEENENFSKNLLNFIDNT